MALKVNPNIKTPLLAFGVLLLVLGGIVAWKNYTNAPSTTSATAATSSDNTTASSGSSSSWLPSWLGGGSGGGDKSKTLKVCVNTWTGFIPLVAYNNGFKPNPESQFTKKHGINVEFVKNDKLVQARQAWDSGEVDLMWTTFDCYGMQTAFNLAQKPQGVVQVDWSRGADLVVARGQFPNVASLKGQKWAVANDSPSFTLTAKILAANNLSPKDVQLIKADDGVQAMELFRNDTTIAAATIWAPDDQQLIKDIPGVHVLTSTKEASAVIADGFYAKADFIEGHKDLIEAFVQGVLEANALMNTDKGFQRAAVTAGAKAFEMPEAFFADTISGVRFATYGDNVNFFDLQGNYSGVKGSDLYNGMAGAFRDIGALTNQPPPWRDVVNTNPLKNLAGKLGNRPEQAAENALTFSAPTEQIANARSVASKSATINFVTGSAELDATAKAEIDRVFRNVTREFGGARFRISGHTDSTGDKAANRKLSELRARSALAYISGTYHLDKNQFVAKGFGPDKPIADNTSEAGKAANRRTELEILDVH